MLKLLITLLYFLKQSKSETYHGGILYPRESETRQTLSLDGLWNFVVPARNNLLQGFADHWYKKHLRDVSYNNFLL